MNRPLLLVAVVAASAASTLYAGGEEEHGHFDVFIGISGSQTAYGGIDVDDGDVTPNQRVFEAEMGELGNIFIADEPGFNHPEDDAALPAGVTSLSDGDEIFVRKLPLTVDGNTTDLFFWDGVGGASFAPATGVNFDIVTDLPNQSIGTAGAGGGFDDHPFFELSAGGSLPTPGIYLGSFEAQVNELNPTASLFLVMGTEGLITADFLGVSQEEFDLLTDEQLDEELEEVIEVAAGYVVRNVVPEPSAVLLLTMGSLGLLHGRIRRRS